jgi:2-iminoacetate synthase
MQTLRPETRPPLHTYVEWLRDTDDHADFHLALIERVERAWDACAVNEESHSLAEKLDRWRYQHLHERGLQLSPRDEAFVDALDLTANRLAGRAKRPPRQTRQSIHDASLDTGSIRRAAETLDPQYPLEQLIDQAYRITADHFGTPAEVRPGVILPRRMLLYAPLYVSSECVNYCTYCGFRYPLDIERRHLTLDEVVEQIAVLRKRGFGHLLIVGGDFPRLTSAGYYRDIVRATVRADIDPAIEIAPQTTSAYEALVADGVRGLTLYQETYDEQLYAKYHVRGPKSGFHWRLESQDRAAEAGMPRLGLGVLLGLAEPRQDVSAMMRHAVYLRDRFPDRTLAFSLPRIHEAPEGFSIKHPVSDAELIRLYCALRIAFPRAELVLSTRESTPLRNRLARICITQMSAGSSTTPGGYGSEPAAGGQQFPVSDDRTPSELAEWLEGTGFHVAWSFESAR